MHLEAGTSTGAGSPASFFDAHNHIHMSMPGGVPRFDAKLLDKTQKGAPEVNQSIVQHAGAVADFFPPGACVNGMALMSTQPRDFVAVEAVCSEFDRRHDGAPFRSVRCYGVHPWFIHEAEADGSAFDVSGSTFWWEQYLRQSLIDDKSACVGEIGLDSIHFDPQTGKPHTNMERQVEAFELQLRIATELNRPVSIHAVQAWGPMMDTLNKKFGKKKGDKPPRMYFHAFGGKPAVVNQIDAACRGTGEVIYGFAPCVNFRSHKTAEVIRKIGIDRLVLESDRENFRFVTVDLVENVKYIAEALNIDEAEVIKKTTENAMRFYDL